MSQQPLVPQQDATAAERPSAKRTVVWEALFAVCMMCVVHRLRFQWKFVCSPMAKLEAERLQGSSLSQISNVLSGGLRNKATPAGLNEHLGAALVAHWIYLRL